MSSPSESELKMNWDQVKIYELLQYTPSKTEMLECWEKSGPKSDKYYVGMAAQCKCGESANAHSFIYPDGCKGFELDMMHNSLDRDGRWVPDGPTQKELP